MGCAPEPGFCGLCLLQPHCTCQLTAVEERRTLNKSFPWALFVAVITWHYSSMCCRTTSSAMKSHGSRKATHQHQIHGRGYICNHALSLYLYPSIEGTSHTFFQAYADDHLQWLYIVNIGFIITHARPSNDLHLDRTKFPVTTETTAKLTTFPTRNIRYDPRAKPNHGVAIAYSFVTDLV
jgi:hypothetical protein